MLPRGQGKSSLTVVLALYELLAGAEGAQVVVVATDERQAGIVHRVASRFLARGGLAACSRKCAKRRSGVPGCAS
jgi:phage terminase large subunit-like protein